MPNWCKIEITVDGDMEKVIPLISGKDQDGNDCQVTFNVLIPMPEEIHREDMPFGLEDDPSWWYRWSINNWGTKWDACSADIEGNAIRFSTAWNVPMPWLERFAEKLGELGITAHVNLKCEGDDDPFKGYDISDGTLQEGEATEEFKDGWRD